MSRKSKRRIRLIFEIVPLIDVMMVLCLFFAILAFLPELQNAFDTKLPKALNSEKAKEAIIVAINSRGVIYIQDEVVTKNELSQELKKRLKNNISNPILLAADSNLKYEKVVEILDVMKSSGALQVGLVTETEELK